MKNFFRELKDYLFYGTLDGIIIEKRHYVDCSLSAVIMKPDLTVITLSKKVHFLGKDRLKTKDVIVNSGSVEKFNIGDYYFAE